MKIKNLFFLMLLSLINISNGFASTDLLPKVPFEVNIKEEKRPAEVPATWPGRSTSERVSFPTCTGFVLFRKEELIYLTVNPKSNGLLLVFWSRGKVEEVASNLSVANAIQVLKTFPFVKISRSTIVNMQEVSQYIGTRRDASLQMTNGALLKMSRTNAGKIHDWIKHLGQSD